jgi:hypothetical protein
MLLPFCRKPNHPIMDVIEKLHGDIYVLLMPNAGGEPRPMAEATQERKLLGVGSSAWFGMVSVWDSGRLPPGRLPYGRAVMRI